MALKILYAGSPEPAAKALEILIEKQSAYNFEIVGVLSNPPSAKGRHKTPTPTAVAALALSKGIPVLTPEHLNSDARQAITPLNPQLLVCFAYGHIFGPKFLEMFTLGGINLHPSLLPKYRGCTPVNAAILNRDSKTAVTIQTISQAMDEGDILAQEIVPLNFTETAESLLNTSAEIGANLIADLLKEINEKNAVPQGKKQSGEPSYTSVITKNDGKIDWSEPVEIIEAKIRAYYPDPACWCLENDANLKILNSKLIPEADDKAKPYAAEVPGKVVAFVKAEGIYIKANGGILVVKELQRQGKKAMNYKDFMNGARDFIGTVLK